MHIKKTMKAYLNKRTCFKACRNLGARLMLKEKMILPLLPHQPALWC